MTGQGSLKENHFPLAKEVFKGVQLVPALSGIHTLIWEIFFFIIQQISNSRDEEEKRKTGKDCKLTRSLQPPLSRKINNAFKNNSGLKSSIATKIQQSLWWAMLSPTTAVLKFRTNNECSSILDRTFRSSVQISIVTFGVPTCGDISSTMDHVGYKWTQIFEFTFDIPLSSIHSTWEVKKI